jgi:hypothetical protein
MSEIFGGLAKVLRNTFTITQAQPITALTIGISLLGSSLERCYVLGTIVKDVVVLSIMETLGFTLMFD